MAHSPITNPRAISDAGERIYLAKYKTDFEANHPGKFVAINVNKETASLGETPEAALQAGRKDDPNGLFHLLRVGSPGAFQISYAFNHGHQDWLFG